MEEIERDRLWTSEDVCRYLNLKSKRLLDQWAYLGKGPSYIKVGKHRRYRPADVEEWLRDQTVMR